MHWIGLVYFSSTQTSLCTQSSLCLFVNVKLLPLLLIATVSPAWTIYTVGYNSIACQSIFTPVYHGSFLGAILVASTTKEFAPIKVCSKEISAAHAVHEFFRFTLKQKKDHVANTVNCSVIPSSTAYQVLYMHYLFGISIMPICKLLMYTRSNISYSTGSACLPCAYYKIFVACFTYENLSNEIYSMKMCCNKLSVFTTCWGLMECYHGNIWWTAFGGLLL